MISIIIPVYNHAHTIERCLLTIAMQTVQDKLEIIIVNDGSTDNFHEALQKAWNNNPEIKKLDIQELDQENLGAPAARNKGIKEASGEYVIFVDADTICDPNMLAEMLKTLEQNPVASYAYSQFRFGWKKMQSHEFDGQLLKKINYIDVTSMVRRKDLVLFDESIKRFQDWDLWLTMLEQGKTGIFIPKVLYKKIVLGRVGYSSWLPSWFYRLPWKTKKVKDYEVAKQIVIKKHDL